MKTPKQNTMKTLKISMVAAFLLLGGLGSNYTSTLLAQAPPPPPGSDNPAPLGGIALLVAAGAAYGSKKAYDRHYHIDT